LPQAGPRTNRGQSAKESFAIHGDRGGKSIPQGRENYSLEGDGRLWEGNPLDTSGGGCTIRRKHAIINSEIIRFPDRIEHSRDYVSMLEGKNGFKGERGFGQNTRFVMAVGA